MKIQRVPVCFFILCLSVLTSVAQSSHSFPMEIPVNSARNLSFKVQEGEFILRGDPNATTVRMNVSIDRFFLFRLGEQDILERLIKVTRPDANSVSIVTDIPHSITNWGRAQYPIDFEVIVPARMNVQLHYTSGVVKISDISGNVEIEDGSGTLSLARIGGNLRVQKSSGDVRVRQVRGTTLINNRSGQMRFEELGPLDIEESDGNLSVTDVESAKIRNGSGNVQVVGVKGAVVLHDTSGEIVVRNAGGTVDITDTSGQIRTANTGAVSVHDTDGNITVENAPGLKVLDKESGEVMVRAVPGPVDVPSTIKVKRKG